MSADLLPRCLYRVRDETLAAAVSRSTPVAVKPNWSKTGSAAAMIRSRVVSM